MGRPVVHEEAVRTDTPRLRVGAPMIEPKVVTHLVLSRDLRRFDQPTVT